MGNSKRKCKYCKEYKPAYSGETHPIGWFCSKTHVRDWYIATREKDTAKKLAKVKREKAKKNKAASKDLREFNRKDRAWQHKRTQKVFNRMRVLEEMAWFRDNNQEPTCISCGKPIGGDQWSCGHFKTVGAQGGLRYDRENSKIQHNRNCNMGLSGDIYGTKKTRGYIQGLKDRFGEEEGNKIIDYCETNTGVVKWEWQDLEAMRKEFNQRIRELEKELG